MLPGEVPFRIGDQCRAETRIILVINNDSGKAVKVGRFSDHQNAFEAIINTRVSFILNMDTSSFANYRLLVFSQPCSEW
jgi:hypothetical protein